MQVGDQVFWTWNGYPGLIHSANNHWASMTGIMGHIQGGNRGTFYALRLGIPGHGNLPTTGDLDNEIKPASGGGPEETSDPLLGPLVDQNVPEDNTDPLLGPVADPS
jgi:hypothetical protein